MPFIVFDLDGTLIDSQLDLAESTNEMLATYGVPALPVETVVGMIGEGARTLVARARAASGLDPAESEALARFLEIYDERLLRHTRPYDGVPELLATVARRADLAVLTNKPLAPTRRLLDTFEISRHFRWVMGGDAAFPRKPDPRSLRHLMQQAGASPSSTLFVGDSMIDVETARQAGIPICVARYGFGCLRGEAGLDSVALSIDTPGGLITVLNRLFCDDARPETSL